MSANPLRQTRRREAPTTEEDPIFVVNGFDTAWNAHNKEDMLGSFTCDAIIQTLPSLPGEPEAHAGKEEMRSFLPRHMPDFRSKRVTTKQPNTKKKWETG